MFKKIRLLAYLPNPSDSTSYYRGLVPLSELQNKFQDVEVSYFSNPDQINWAMVYPYDAVFVQRPASELEWAMVKLLKIYRKKVWVDYDDLITQVPTHNPVYDVYADCKARVADIVSMADIITVSTEKIKEELQKYNLNIQVVPNAHNDLLYPMSKIKQPTKYITGVDYYYRGSITHEMDLFDEEVRMANLIEDNGSNFTCYGELSPVVKELLGIEHSNKPTDIIMFLNLLYNSNHNVLVFPLINNEFNQAKSNIAWLEATYCGGIAVSNTELPEWSKIPCLNIKDLEEYKYKIPFEVVQKYHDLSHNYILNAGLLLSVQNQTRYTILKTLINS